MVDRLAADDASLSCDSGTVATWAGWHWRIGGDRQLSLAGNLATMAAGLPHVITGQWASPDRQGIGFIGDGGLAMPLAELDTAAREELPITLIVNHNASLGQIEWEQGCSAPPGRRPRRAGHRPRPGRPGRRRLPGPGGAGR